MKLVNRRLLLFSLLLKKQNMFKRMKEVFYLQYKAVYLMERKVK